MSDLRTVPLSEIRENPVALRSVNHQSAEYLGLVESIKQKGFLGVITVREQIDAESGVKFFEIVDGLHRYCAAKDAGLTEIGVDVLVLDKAGVLEAQLLANVHHVESKPAEYSAQLKRILTINPLLTEAELATKLGKSTQWVGERLSLNKIDNKEIVELIDSGKINLSNAYALAKLPPAEMANFIDSAIVEAPAEFLPKINARVKEIREQRRKGDQEAPVAFQPVAHARKLKDIKEQAGTIDGVAAMTQVGPMIVTSGVTDVVEAGKLALLWVLHLDPVSKAAQVEKDEERKAAKAEKDKIAAAEKAAKKQKTAEENAKEAADAAAKAQAALAGRGTVAVDATTEAEAEIA